MSTPSFQPAFTEGNFVPEDVTLPQDPIEFQFFLKDTLEKHAKLINRKDNGQYESIEIQNNQTFPGADPQNKRMIFRKIVDCGALPNTATKTVAHGIANFSEIRVTRLYGAATNPGVAAIPLPYLASSGFANSLEMYIDAINVILIAGIDRTAYTSTFVIIEYYRT